MGKIKVGKPSRLNKPKEEPARKLGGMKIDAKEIKSQKRREADERERKEKMDRGA